LAASYLLLQMPIPHQLHHLLLLLVLPLPLRQLLTQPSALLQDRVLLQ
jgi:hypothetical protein